MKKPKRTKGRLPGSPLNATPNYRALRPATPSMGSSELQRVMSPSYEGFLSWVSEADLAALCREAAQELDFTDPYTHTQKRTIMRHAFTIHQRRTRRRRLDHHNATTSRRRARKHTTAIEYFTRAEIIERDQATCHICGKRCQPVEIHLDHVIPLSKGGPHTKANVRVACASCNIRKGASTPSDR